MSSIEERKFISISANAPLTNAHLRGEDQFRQDKTWKIFLAKIADLAKERGLHKKLYISYAQPTNYEGQNKLQKWLKSLQDNLRAVGILCSPDSHSAQAQLDITVQKHLKESDFVLLILTPDFLKMVQEEKSNLVFEFRLIKEKAESNPNSMLPILFSGSFEEVIKGPLIFLSKQTVYMEQVVQMKKLLIGLNDPLGLIPRIYGFHTGDRSYQELLASLQANSLTGLPPLLFNFVERSMEMSQLKTGFERQIQRNLSPTQVICGMGGIGKTQLAINYASSIAEKFDFVHWIYADTSTLASEWISLGEQLGLDLKGTTEADWKRLIQQVLSEKPSWFLILDNVESQTALNELLPEIRTATQQVLITSRSKNWNKEFIVNISLFTLEQCEMYCRARLLPVQYEGIVSLVKQLEYLPLALSHAVAYMQQSDLNALEYLKRYRRIGIILLGKELETEAKIAGYPGTILTTWQLSIQHLENRNPKAAELIRFCGYLYPDGIQRNFLKDVLNLDDLALDECIRIIGDYALITREINGFKIHRLVQAAICYQEEKALPMDERLSKRLGPLARMLHKRYPFEKRTDEDFASAKKLQMHLETVSGALESFVKAKLSSGNLSEIYQAGLLNALGDLFLTVLGDANKGLVFNKRALEIQLKIYGSIHLDVATSYSNLGNAYLDLGNAEEACECQKKALSIQLKIYNDEGFHPSVANSYNRLGLAKDALGDAEGALKYHKKSLEIRLKIYGEEHVDVAKSYNNLGIVYDLLKNFQEALRYHEKALAIRLKIFREAHPDVAMSYNNLGSVYDAMKKAKKALEYYEKALTIYLKVYDETHPDVAMSYNNFGDAYNSLGNTQKAFYYHRKALTIYLKVHKVHDETHPDVAMSYNGLGEVYQAIEDPKNAFKYYENAFKIRLKVHKKKHPDIAISYNNLAWAYQSLGDIKKAIDYYKEALKIRLNIYKETHPDVAIIYSNLGEAYRILGNTKEAFNLQKKALMNQLEMYKNHPDVAVSYNRLGLIYQAMGNYKEAVECHRKAVVINIEFYGDSLHPNTAFAYERLGAFYQDNSNYAGAEFYLKKALHIYQTFDRQQSANRIQCRLEVLASSHLLGYLGTFFSSTRPTDKLSRSKPTKQMRHFSAEEQTSEVPRSKL